MRTPACSLAFDALRSKSGSCALYVTVDLPFVFKKVKPPRRQPGVDAQSRAGCLVRLKRREVGNGRCAPQLELAQHHPA